MKKRINTILFVAITLFLFNSCESFIDLQPLDKISTNDYWKTTTDLANYTLQFYPIAFANSNMVVDMAVNSDEMIYEGVPSSILNGNRVRQTGKWTGDWTTIRNVNIFLANYKNCTAAFNDYKHYLGEAYFFRAYFYYALLQKYGDLPWYSKPINLDSEIELTQPRVSRTIIADSIIADLDKAVLYLNNRIVAGNNRLNKETALAFTTRVALYEGTWEKYHANTPFGKTDSNPTKYFQKCVSAGEELINGTSYKKGIYSTGKTDLDYYQLFGLVDMSSNNEVLFYKAFSFADGFSNTVEGYLSYNANQKGITWDLVSSYLGKNGLHYDYINLAKTTKGNAFLTKIAADCDARLKSTIYIPGDVMGVAVSKTFDKPTISSGALQLCPTGFQIKKTTNPLSRGAAQDWAVRSETGLIYFRYAEVLLNYAEAKCEIDNTVAITQLNLLRARVGMPSFTVNSQNLDLNKLNYGYVISDELYEIRRERRVELALEGFRDDDLMRWAAHSLFKGKRPKGYPVSKVEFPTYFKAIDSNGLIDYYSIALPSGYKFREGQDYLYSIPQDELVLNPNLLQNPGW